MRPSNIGSIASSSGRNSRERRNRKSMKVDWTECEMLYGERCGECGISLNQHATGMIEYCDKCKPLIKTRKRRWIFC